MTQSIRCVLKEVRCTFPKLFQAEEFQGKTRFSVGLILQPGSPQLAKVEKACRDAVVAAFGEAEADKKIRQMKQSKTTWPIRSMEDGTFMITPKRDISKGAPVVLDGRKNQIPEQAGLPYGGCWLNVSLDAYCYSKMGSGVTLYLNGVQLVREDAALAGASTAASCKDDFEELENTGSDDDDIAF